jgi:hypothetical protein
VRAALPIPRECSICSLLFAAFSPPFNNRAINMSALTHARTCTHARTPHTHTHTRTPHTHTHTHTHTNAKSHHPAPATNETTQARMGARRGLRWARPRTRCLMEKLLLLPARGRLVRSPARLSTHTLLVPGVTAATRLQRREHHVPTLLTHSTVRRTACLTYKGRWTCGCRLLSLQRPLARAGPTRGCVRKSDPFLKPLRLWMRCVQPHNAVRFSAALPVLSVGQLAQVDINTCVSSAFWRARLLLPTALSCCGVTL